MEEVRFRLNEGDLEIFVDNEWKYCSSYDNNIQEIANDIMGMLGIPVIWGKEIREE